MAVLLQHMLCICPMHSMTLQGNKDPEVDKYKNVYVVQMDEIVHRYVRLGTYEFQWKEHAWFVLRTSSFEEAVESLVARVQKDHKTMTLHNHDPFPFGQANQNPASSPVLVRVEPTPVREWAPKVTFSHYMMYGDYKEIVEEMMQRIANSCVERTGTVKPVF